MDKRIEALHGHIILAGLGRVGRQAAGELAEARMPFLVLDPAEHNVRVAEEHGWLWSVANISPLRRRAPRGWPPARLT